MVCNTEVHMHQSAVLSRERALLSLDVSCDRLHVPSAKLPL